MISHTRRIIFVHIPKAAGTSIETVLGHLDGHDLHDGQDHRTLRQLQFPHGGVAQFGSLDNLRECAKGTLHTLRRHANPKNDLRVSATQFAAYYKFAVVRNPWDRAYSWYKNVLRDELHGRRLGAAPEVSFRDFLNAYAGIDLLRPQLHWLVNFHGRVGIDQVCRFETLQADFDEVCRKANIAPTALPHALRSEGGSYIDAYDDATARLVADRFREEIELFGYAFGATA